MADDDRSIMHSPPLSATTPTSSWKLKLLLVTLGCVLALLPEVVLRLLGFGGLPPFLTPLVHTDGAPSSDVSRLYEVNARLGEIFFTRSGPEGVVMVAGHRRELVRMPKPEGVVRVLFAGASTVEGFPLPRNLTSSQFLERMLQHLMPDSEVEVVNLGLTAVASFPVRKVAEQAMSATQPDLLLLYGGHNEFFGASGMASLQSMGRSPWAMEAVYRFRRSAMAQFGREIFAPPPASLGESRKHLLEVMAASDSISPEGSLHAAARHSLVENFRHVIRRARALEVPMVISTVVSNERSFVPLASSEVDLDVALRDDWRMRLAEAGRIDARDGQARVEAYSALVAEAPRHAGAVYGLAQALASIGDSGAGEQFRRARDLDALPWRANRDKSEALRELARVEGVALADIEAAFSDAAGGATSWAQFYDHVHPSLYGQALLARAFLDAIVEHQLLAIDTSRLADLPDWPEIALALGANPLEHYVVVHKMATLFAVPPAAPRNDAAASRFARLQEEMRDSADAIDLAAIVKWETASREAGFALPISYFGASSALEAGDSARAQAYLTGAIGSAFPFADDRCAAYLLDLVAALRRDDRATFDRRIGPYLDEAEFVATMPEQPSALLAHALAGMHLLAGDSVAAETAQRLRDDAPTASAPWLQTYLRELPSLEQLAELAPRS